NKGRQAACRPFASLRHSDPVSAAVKNSYTVVLQTTHEASVKYHGVNRDSSLRVCPRRRTVRSARNDKEGKWIVSTSEILRSSRISIMENPRFPIACLS